MVAGVSWDDTTGNPIDSESLDLAANDGSVTQVRKTSNEELLVRARRSHAGRRAARSVGQWHRADSTDHSRAAWRGRSRRSCSTRRPGKPGIAAPSFTSRVTYALTPNFSPDGSLLAFNNRDASAGHTLSVMSYDGSATPPAFSQAAQR